MCVSVFVQRVHTDAFRGRICEFLCVWVVIKTRERECVFEYEIAESFNCLSAAIMAAVYQGGGC